MIEKIEQRIEGIKEARALMEEMAAAHDERWAAWIARFAEEEPEAVAAKAEAERIRAFLREEVAAVKEDVLQHFRITGEKKVSVAGVQERTRYSVVGDPLEIKEWAQKHAPITLVVDTKQLETVLKSLPVEMRPDFFQIESYSIATLPTELTKGI